MTGLEYCNAPLGSRVADQRAENGHADPYGVKLWCLGNEMDGEWQLGHVPAHDYAVRGAAGREADEGPRPDDPDGRVRVERHLDPTFAQWDREVLRYVGDHADYVSLHRYAENHAHDTPEFLATGASIDRQIEAIDAVCRTVQAERRSKKRAYLCFDEWNVWYKNYEVDGAGKRAPHLIEEI